MARIARIVVANLPHHITQRGNRRQKTFFQDEDYRLYRSLMADWCNKDGETIHNVFFDRNFKEEPK